MSAKSPIRTMEIVFLPLGRRTQNDPVSSNFLIIFRNPFPVITLLRMYFKDWSLRKASGEESHSDKKVSPVTHDLENCATWEHMRFIASFYITFSLSARKYMMWLLKFEYMPTCYQKTPSVGNFWKNIFCLISFPSIRLNISNFQIFLMDSLG